MGKYDSTTYDDPREWIQKRYEKKSTWAQIRMAGRNSVEELSQFLKGRVSDDGWPPMSIDEWTELVNECEEYEKSQEDIAFRGNDGALFDKNQDNGLSVPKNDRSCWQMYKKNLGWKPESIKELEYATIGILRRLSNDTRTIGPVKGLVIGHVQSGKTANMEALMAMAADHGWNFFIVLSGTIENLRLQTLQRMQKDLNREGNLIWRGIEHPRKNAQFGDRAQDCHFERDAQSRYFTVCLKNASRLRKLIDWIHTDRASHNQMKILIIDDEADQASISNTATEYRQEAKERKGINKLIVDLVNDVHYNENKTTGKAQAINYVMYTATPYANFLNESTPESLYPTDFIWTLKPSSEYIGPEQIFGLNDPDKPDGLDIKRIVTQEDLDAIKKLYEGENDDLPERLKDSICWFICATAVMRYWGYRKPISMLVHTSQKQVCHEAVANAISHWINGERRHKAFIERCQSVYEYEINRIPKQEWLEEFPDYGVPAEQIRDYPSFDVIKSGIKELLSMDMQHIKMTDEGDFQYQTGLHLVIDNCSKNGLSAENEHVRLAYPDPDMEPYPSPAPAFIIVGGSTLSRGLTIEGLVSTFFLRASCQADSLMQMGRWFGYRRNYELLPRLWMTQDTIDKFRFLSELEVDLRDDLKKYMYNGVRPDQYAPRILATPKVSWLKITSKKHMTNAVPADMDYSGAKPQTTIFDNDKDLQNRNTKITEDFLKSLGSHTKESSEHNALCWRGVKLQQIMDGLLIDKFSFSNRSRVFNEIGTFCDWIRQIGDSEELDNWSVIVAGKDTITNASDGISSDQVDRIKNSLCLKCHRYGQTVWVSPFLYDVWFPVSKDGIRIEEYFKGIDDKLCYVDLDDYKNAGITYKDLQKFEVNEDLLINEYEVEGAHKLGRNDFVPYTWNTHDSGFLWKLSLESIRKVLEYIADHSDSPNAMLKSQVIFKLLQMNEEHLQGTINIMRDDRMYSTERHTSEIIKILNNESDTIKGWHWNGKWLYTEDSELVSQSEISRYELNQSLYGKVDPDSELYNLLKFYKSEDDIREETEKEYDQLSETQKESYFEIELQRRFGLTVEDLDDLREGTQHKKKDFVIPMANYEFPINNVKNWNALRKHAAETLYYAEPVKYESVRRSIRVSKTDDSRSYLLNMYRVSSTNKTACQICHQASNNFIATQIEDRQDLELDQLYLCLCPNCASEFRLLRNDKTRISQFIHKITSLNENEIERNEHVEVTIGNKNVWFTQTHIAEIAELLRLKNQVENSKTSYTAQSASRVVTVKSPTAKRTLNINEKTPKKGALKTQTELPVINNSIAGKVTTPCVYDSDPRTVAIKKTMKPVHDLRGYIGKSVYLISEHSYAVVKKCDDKTVTFSCEGRQIIYYAADCRSLDVVYDV